MNETELRERFWKIESFLGSELGWQNNTPGNVNRRIEANRQDADERMEKIEHAYFGNGQMGDRTKVRILWHAYPWLACLCGAVVGAVTQKVLGAW